MGDVAGFRLQKEQEISVFLRLVIVWKEPFLEIGGIFEMTRNFILL
jgi:hypothetical protein